MEYNQARGLAGKSAANGHMALTPQRLKATGNTGYPQTCMRPQIKMEAASKGTVTPEKQEQGRAR
ncbi:hypothetical protein [Pseudomonas sp. A-RE-19]|uniref:hypothetical protein n=1 Tax=Pseudomonas sp. A-RE-19 TaxID=2832401 RepID=UPI001CC06480|nr:hypothetical protein [Pseudomonas sp. A-RE-19]